MPPVTLHDGERSRAQQWLQRYSTAELARRLGVSAFIAGKARDGDFSWETFTRLRRLEGDRFAIHVLGIDPNADLPLLRRHHADTAALIAEAERRQQEARPLPPSNATEATGAPDIVERPLGGVELNDVLAGWLERWRNGSRLNAKVALRLASADPSGRVGVVKRGPRDPFFRCLYVGGRLRFQNADGIRLAGSSTADWQLDPYLATCVRVYGLAVERGTPVIEDVTVHPKLGVSPVETRFRRLVLPFTDRRKNGIVIVASSELQTTYGSRIPRPDVEGDANPHSLCGIEGRTR